jgi:hypothetical protein
MTEAEWIASQDAPAMLRFLNRPEMRRRVRLARKLRLFAVASCRVALHLLPDPRTEAAVDAAEHLADEQTALKDLVQVRETAEAVARERIGHEPGDMTWWVARMASHTLSRHAQDAAWESLYPSSLSVFGGLQPTAQAVIARDLFGPLPFRPVTLDPTWRTSTAVALASQMYDGRDFSAMLILADALQDAGCTSEDVLAHCRGYETHVRGCWVVDLVLGKE